MSSEYTISDGIYRFPDEVGVLELRDVQRDRYGRFWAQAKITSSDGTAILAMDHGDLSSGQWRSAFALQAAKRNSGIPYVGRTWSSRPW